MHEHQHIYKYRLIHRLSAPKQSKEIWLCEDENLGREVAVKFVENDHRARREARIGASLNHPRLLSVLSGDNVRASGRDLFAIAMPYLMQGSLENLLERGGRPSVETSALLFGQVLEGLKALSSLGYYHGDVKTANVLLADGGCVISDFGLSRDRGGALPLPLHSYYIPHVPPECVVSRFYDDRSEVYAAGLLGVEVFCGFSAPKEALHTLGRQRFFAEARTGAFLPRVLPQIPAPYHDVFTKALTIDPNDRYPDIQAFAEAFTALVVSG